MSFLRGAYPEVIAHRGGSLIRPENTLAAFEHARALGVRTIETDLHLTRDGVLVCHHDHTVDRTTNGRGPIHAHTLRELGDLDAGHWFTEDGRTYPFRGRGVRIPTLEETLALCPDTSFILELKTEGPRMARAVHDFLARHEARERVCVASFHEPTLVAFRGLAKTAIRTSAGETRLAAFWALAGLLRGRHPRVPFQMMQIPVSHNRIAIATPSLLAAARACGVAVHVWTINDEAEMRRLLDLGVDALITDAPDRAIRVLRARARA